MGTSVLPPIFPDEMADGKAIIPLPGRQENTRRDPVTTALSRQTV
jgi:hypothetical protein